MKKKINWIHALLGLVIASFFLTGIWAGAQLLYGVGQKIHGALFISAIMLMMFKEVWQGVSFIFDSFRNSEGKND